MICGHSELKYHELEAIKILTQIFGNIPLNNTQLKETMREIRKFFKLENNKI